MAEAITEGWGRLRIDDTSWRVQGPNLAAGTEVTVSAMDGTNLVVKAANHGDE